MKKIETKEIETIDYDQYDELLDCEGAISVAGMQMYPSEILKKCDPIAYECGFSDVQEYKTVYICPICGEEHEEEEEAENCCEEEEIND